MTRDEWAHGSLLILNELLVHSNPEFEKLRSSLDSMVGQVISFLKSEEECVKMVLKWFCVSAYFSRPGS